MGKKLSRKQRKIQRQKELRLQLLQSGYSSKSIAKKNYRELYNDYTIIENQRKEKEQREQERKSKRNTQRKNLHRKKVELLESQGFSFARLLPESITKKIKLSDIETQNVSRETYPTIFEKFDSENVFSPFNFDKVYTLPESIQFYVAFRDFSGNQNIKDIIKDQRKKSVEELLKELEHWNNTPETYDGKSGSSSGSGGDCVVMIGDSGAVHHTQIDAMARNRSKKTREHTGDFKGFQSIKLRDRVFNKDMSTKEILVIATSIMPNVTEKDRKNFYSDLWNGLRHIPEIQKQLPEPK